MGYLHLRVFADRARAEILDGLVQLAEAENAAATARFTPSGRWVTSESSTATNSA
jgi:hypothetical protein